MIKSGVNCMALNVIMKFYKHAKSCISANGNLSDFFLPVLTVLYTCTFQLSTEMRTIEIY